MLLRTLLIVLLIYVIFRVVGNLIRAIRQDGPRSRLDHAPPTGEYRPTPDARQGRAARPPGGPKPHVQVEDAKWRDIP
jgi:hypothetical protein